MLVNGYNCTNCSEELLAKRGIDPSQGATKLALRAQEEHAAAKKSESPLSIPVQGVNAPTPGSDVGSRLNVFA